MYQSLNCNVVQQALVVLDLNALIISKKLNGKYNTSTYPTTAQHKPETTCLASVYVFICFDIKCL